MKLIFSQRSIGGGNDYSKLGKYLLETSVTLPVGEDVDEAGEEVDAGDEVVGVDEGGLVGGEGFGGRMVGGLGGLKPRVHQMEHFPPLESPRSSVSIRRLKSSFRVLIFTFPFLPQ